MSVAEQTIFFEALKVAALGAGATAVYEGVAPSTVVLPYVVYVQSGNTGPAEHTYSGNYREDDVYLVSAVAASRKAAKTLQDAIGDTLHLQRPEGILSIRRENSVPQPTPASDQKRFVAATYYRIIYTQGGS